MPSRLRILAHCLLIGGLVFVLERGVEPPAPTWPTGVGLRAAIGDTADDELLVRFALERNLHRTDPVVRRRLIDNIAFTRAAGSADGVDGVDADDAFEAALDLGMHRMDPLVRRRLSQRAARLLIAEHGDGPVRQAQVDAYLAACATDRTERTQATRFVVQQVFLGRERGAQGERDATVLLERLRGGQHGVEDGGDPPPFDTGAGSWTRRELARRLGDGVAGQLVALPQGHWAGPVRSPYGLHLVRLEALTLPADDTELRARALEDLRGQRDTRALRRGLEALRERYGVELAGLPAAKLSQGHGS